MRAILPILSLIALGCSIGHDSDQAGDQSKQTGNQFRFTCLPYIDAEGHVWGAVDDPSGSKLIEARVHDARLELVSVTPLAESVCAVAKGKNGDLFYCSERRISNQEDHVVLRYCCATGLKFERLLHPRDYAFSMFADEQTAIVLRHQEFGFGGFESLTRYWLSETEQPNSFSSEALQPDLSRGIWHLPPMFQYDIAGGWLGLTTRDGLPNIWRISAAGEVTRLRTERIEYPMAEDFGWVCADFDPALSLVVVCKSVQRSHLHHFEISAWDLNTGKRVYRREPEASAMPVAAAFLGNGAIAACASEQIVEIDWKTGQETRYDRFNRGFLPFALLYLGDGVLGLVKYEDSCYQLLIERNAAQR